MSVTNRGNATSSSAVLLWQVGVGALLLLAWELLARTLGNAWISQPTLVASRLIRLATGDIYVDIFTTLAEMVAGLALGAVAGVVSGLWIGRTVIIGPVLRPIIVAFYSVPLIALTPLLILRFGLGMESKIVLIAVVSYFLLFFNTFSGARTVDYDLILSAQLLGASVRERFVKIVFPATMPWIMSGVKIALPYALVAATTGEMLAARRGLGFQLSQSAAQFDMTGMYSILFILMLLGMAMSSLGQRAEAFILRWRRA